MTTVENAFGKSSHGAQGFLRVLVLLALIFASHVSGAGFSRHRAYIVSIGINQYPADSLLYRPLYSEADATALPPAIATWLEKGSIFQTDTVILLGRQATVDAIRATMQQIAREAEPDDTFVFIFDGMGICVSAQNSYQFAAYDTKLLPNGSVQNPLRSRDVGTLLAQIPARNQYVILDVCGSHKALNDLRAALQPPGDDARPDHVKQVHLIAPDGGSHETRLVGHGLLTATLLDGLAGRADFDKTGRITWDRLVGYATWKLPESLQQAAELDATIRDGSPENLYSLTIYSDASAPFEASRGFPSAPQAQAASPESLGEDYALLIGTDHYSGDWPQLVNPVRDITELRKELVKDYGFHGDADHIIEIHDAKKHDLDPAIARLAEKHFNDNDRMLVYIAGHGHRTYMGGKNLQGYVVFTDSKSPDSEDATDSMESFSDLSDRLDRLGVRHLLLVMDVCYGGLFDGKTNGVTTSFQTMLPATEGSASPTVLTNRALKSASRIYVTSGDENHTVADGEPGQGSPFSRRFLSVLRDNGNNPPYLDMFHLFGGLRSLEHQPMTGYFYSSHVDQGADFIFIPRAAMTPVASLPRSD